MLKREWCIAKIDVHLECVLSASACSYEWVSERACENECVPMCVRSNCLCVVEYFVHVCTQTINMIKKTANEEEENTIHEIGMQTHTHRWGWRWWWLNRLEWQKWRHPRSVFSPAHFERVSPLSPNIYLCDYFDTYTYHFFLIAAIFSRRVSFRFVFGFTFLEFWFYFPRHICLARVLTVFSVFIFCTLRINLPKA